MKGVVDSADLPLNVSRETLQHNPLLAKIKSNVTNRVLKTLEEMKDDEYETYPKFYKEFGQYLKEGAGQDFDNRERLAGPAPVRIDQDRAGQVHHAGQISSKECRRAEGDLSTSSASREA